jgi:hypothetical protein
MKNNELIEVLRTFSKKDMMMLGKFLKSPYFNNRKRMVELYYLLKKFHPAYDPNKLTKEYITEKLFNKEKVSDSTVRSAIHKFLNLIYEFIKVNTAKKHETEFGLYSSQELFKRGLYNSQQKQLVKLRKSLSVSCKRDADYYKNLYSIQTDGFYANLLTKKVLKKSFAVAQSEKLSDGIISFLKYFILMYLVHVDTLLAYSNSYNIINGKTSVAKLLDLLDFDKMISCINEFTGSKTPDLETFHHCINAFANFDDEECYEKFRKSFSRNSKYLMSTYRSHLHARMISYLNMKITSGAKSSFNVIENSLKLYHEHITEEYYKFEFNKHLPFDMYRNVLLCCISLKKISYMEKFIETNLKNILPERGESVKLYSYALLNFAKGFYFKSIDNLNKIPKDEFVLKLDIRNLKTKIYYETQKWEEAISILDSYKHFLKNNKLVNIERQIRHKNFIEYVQKMIYHRTGSKEVNINFLLKDENKLLNTFDREWIIDKLSEFKMSNSYCSDKVKKVRITLRPAG